MNYAHVFCRNELCSCFLSTAEMAKCGRVSWTDGVTSLDFAFDWNSTFNTTIEFSTTY